MKMLDPNETKKETISSIPEGFIKIQGLPSNCKFYTTNEIYGKSLNVFDVKQLASLSDDIEETNRALKSVIDKNIKGIKYEELLKADVYYLILWFRSKTYISGDLSKINFYNSKYKKQDSYTFNLNDLNIVELTEEKYKKTIEGVQLPVSNKNYKLKQLKIIDDKKLENYKEQLKDLHDNIDDELLSLAYSIETIDNEKPKSTADVYDYICNEMSPTDFISLQKYAREISIGTDSQMEVESDLDKQENNKEDKGGAVTTNVTVPFLDLQSFFLPI